jgi:hypothetical protein
MTRFRSKLGILIFLATSVIQIRCAKPEGQAPNPAKQDTSSDISTPPTSSQQNVIYWTPPGESFEELKGTWIFSGSAAEENSKYSDLTLLQAFPDTKPIHALFTVDQDQGKLSIQYEHCHLKKSYRFVVKKESLIEFQLLTAPTCVPANCSSECTHYWTSLEGKFSKIDHNRLGLFISDNLFPHNVTKTVMPDGTPNSNLKYFLQK